MHFRIIKRIACQECDEDNCLKEVEIGIDVKILCSDCIRVLERQVEKENNEKEKL